ncbi:MAG TPA: glycosyltransferase [Terracidiphilus sp.]|nr:glycosyltransferase [Terracidiphilus sp.]
MKTTEQNLAGSELADGVTVIELVPSIAPESFGLGYAALNLAASLERAGVNVFLASVDEEKVARAACEAAGFPQERFVRGHLIGPSRLRLAPLMMRQLRATRNGGRAIIHMHGTWTYTSYAAGALSRRWRCPLVLSPHGELAPYALSISRWKKALASRLYARRNLRYASCVCALSEQEKVAIRATGFDGRVEVLPSGASRAIECSAEEIADFRGKHNIAPGARILLFLSRIARIKNLPMLLRTFANSVKTQPGWVLLIAGSDEDGHIREVQALIRNLGIETSVRMIGPIWGREKACAFTSASLFVLPSHSEGLPIVVLEAMEYGKPLLLTDVWTLPVETDAVFSWRVSGEHGAFGAALLEAMSTSEERLKEMGLASRAVVRAHFGWDRVARKACSLYASLLAGASQSEFDELNNIRWPSSI